MSLNFKIYENKDGYKIKATEKAYKLFYKKQGFMEVKENKAGKKNAEEEGKGAAPDASPETPKLPKKKKAE